MTPTMLLVFWFVIAVARRADIYDDHEPPEPRRGTET
jgi:hypothetical protein